MGTLSTIALVVLGISFMTFVAFFGRLPALRHTPIAFLHKLLWVHIPNAVLALDERLTSGRLTSSCGRFGRYMMYDRHPTVLIFFILLLSVSEYMYLPYVWPRLSTTHQILGAISIALPYLFLYLAAAADPGVITPANHIYQMAQYPFDFTLFHPGSACRTCHLLKPARSKHCSVCKVCVARMDHHCIFINNCVGVGNQHWFVLLLLSTAVLTSYGAALGLGLLSTKMATRYPGWSLWPFGTDLKSWLIAWSWGLQDNVGMGSVTMLALLTSPLVWGLLTYHVYLIYCGTTTNESMKWSDWKAEMDDGYVFKRKMARDRVKDLRFEPEWTRWPAETQQIVVRTEDGRPPAQGQDIPGEGEWIRIWSLRDVENLYDLGFADNLTDVFRSGYVFNPDMPHGESRDY
ncbi:Palmitoyltransferase [Pleurostoma richardsiae]|uniref:Palmitoyltransferase n=1 Tax=Pleurostoma richardsiae TaxID=41990 RepID=A0AA38VK43_9PEZI|nr:Palmitoyltransferase [Pleurostoma richardsiae]